MTEARPKAAINAEEGPCVMPEDLEMLPKTGVAAFVERFAHVHNLTAKRSRLNDWAEAVSRAAGDDIRLDHVELLLVALTKRDLISGRQAARLLTLYLTEKAAVRLPQPQEDDS